MANWDAGSLSPQQLGFIRDAMRARKRGNLGPVELAGLLQEGGEFMPMRDMRLGDIRRTTPGRSGTTLGQWRGGPNKRIVINPAFPGAKGPVVGHELGHEGFSRYGVRATSPASHSNISAYLQRHYDVEPRYWQTSPDVSRPIGSPRGSRGKSATAGAYGASNQRATSIRLPTRSAPPTRYGLNRLVREMEQSDEGKRRQAWYDANRNRMLQMIFRSEQQGRGR